MDFRWICQSSGSGTAAARRVRAACPDYIGAQIRTGASLVLSDWQIHDIAMRLSYCDSMVSNAVVRVSFLVSITSTAASENT